MAKDEPKVTVRMGFDVDGDWHAKPLALIAGVTAGTKAMEGHVREAVHLARQQGVTWEEIGKALGVSRQAAWERYSTN